MSENGPIPPPEGWDLWQQGDQWCAAGDAHAEVHPVGVKWWAQVCAPERPTRKEAEQDRLAMVHALAGAPVDLQGQLDQITEVHKALDEVKAPPNERLVERVRWLGQRLNEAWLTRAAWMEDVRKALNIGPPSDSDVREGTSAAELVRIVRVRNELMLEERARRVALAQEVEALKRQAEQEHVKLIARLDGWMSGDETNVRRELEDQVIRAVEAGSVTAHDAINALRHRRSLAELVLAVDFGDNDIPF